MHVHGYWAYGLRINAELECPELYPRSVPAGNPDVTIRLLPPRADALDSLENSYYEVQPRAFRLAVPGVAHYRVEDGCRIIITPLPDVSSAEMRLYLLGSAMGALLYQRGLFPLHGSAVETPWGAMIFVGEQGVGKSTLAAQFHRKGYRLLSDDVCAVATKAEGLEVLPAVAQFRLCSDAYERMGGAVGARFDVDKFVVPMGDGYCPHPVPLRAIHVLADSENDRVEFELLRGFERVQRLLENLYRPQYLKGQDTQNDLMRLAGLIARKAAIATVSRQRDTEAIGGLVGFLESAWAECFGPTFAEEKN
jgi:hypothetical protein